MHAGWVKVAADVAELLAAGLVILYCRISLRRDWAVRAPWQELMRAYPDLDRELDMIWQCYRG
jgi:hypothetical protein